MTLTWAFGQLLTPIRLKGASHHSLELLLEQKGLQVLFLLFSWLVFFHGRITLELEALRVIFAALHALDALAAMAALAALVALTVVGCVDCVGVSCIGCAGVFDCVGCVGSAG